MPVKLETDHSPGDVVTELFNFFLMYLRKASMYQLPINMMVYTGHYHNYKATAATDLME